MTWTSSGKLFVTGIILLFFGVTMIILEPYERIFKKITILYPNGIIFGYWHQSDVHLKLHVYIFNITNKDAFLAGKEKLKLQEVGPYIYREDAIHHNITFNNEDGTISSSPRYTLHWVPELNKGKETDKLVLPHLAMLLVSSKFSYLKFPLNAFIEQTNSLPIVEQTAREFLFGYDSPFTDVASKWLSFWIKFKKLGVLDRLYDHEGDVATTFSGALDRRLAGLFATYNENSQLPHWDAPCSNISGSSDGKKFGNGIKPNDTVSFYRKGLCRAFQLKTVSGEMTDKYGVPAFYYKAEENIFDNGAINERNKCFCKTKPCLPITVHDISDCFYGFPVGISFPHFLNGSDALREPYESLNPNMSTHDTSAFINPQTGYIAEGSVKLQLNAILGDLSGINRVESFSNRILPLAWANFSLDRIEPEINFLLFLLVKCLPALETFLSVLFIVVGISMITLYVKKCTQAKYDPSSTRNQIKIEIEQQEAKKGLNTDGEQLHSLIKNS